MFDKLKRLDWITISILVGLFVFSTMVIYSATIDNPLFGPKRLYIRNALNYGLGFMVMIGAALIDYRFIVKYSKYLYAVGVLLVFAVYFFGSEINGAKGWFELPYFSFQPAELMKLMIILLLAAMLAKSEGGKLQTNREVVPIILVVGLPFLLVLIQPDLGNAIVYLVILLGMLWIGNIKYTHVLIGLVAFVAMVTLFLYLFNEYHEEIREFSDQLGVGHWVSRIDTFLDPEGADPNASYQVTKSKIAVGSGRFSGDGFLGGNSVHNNVIPYAYSDSIFVVIAEEFGFLGSSIVLLIYFLLMYRMIIISIRSSTLSGSYIIIGIVSMFVFQIFENIGMLIGIMPLTGITLPFISYGGTSLLINMLSLGIVMSIQIHQDKKRSLFEE